MNYILWAENALKQGPPPVNIDSPITTWDDYTLAMQHQFHVEQVKRCKTNLQTLEIWPEHRSELFNESTIESDIDHHISELTVINEEMHRRMMP